MAKKIFYICDRCKTEFTYNHKEYDNRNLHLYDWDSTDEYDLCPECHKSLERWFDDPKKEGE